MKFVFSFALIVLLLYSCKSSSHKEKSSNQTKDTAQFYPVTDYLKEQIRQVDNTPYFIYRITVKNGKRDSSVINQKTFDSLANEFVKDDITKPPLKNSYTENIFEDVSTNSYTLSYTTSSPKLNLQNIDILLSRDDQKVKWVFMNKIEVNDSTTITKKLGWKPDRRFYINETETDKNGKVLEEQNTIVWNDKE